MCGLSDYQFDNENFLSFQKHITIWLVGTFSRIFKAFRTSLWRKGLFDNCRNIYSLNLHLFLQIFGLTEPSATSKADVWFFSCLESPVNYHLVWGFERFTTLFTNHSPLQNTCVCSMMLVLITFMAKRFWTKVTLVLPVSTVDIHVEF